MLPCRPPMVFISSSEVPYDASYVCAAAFVLPHALASTAVSAALDPSLPSPLESSGVAHRGPTSAQATHPLDCPACRLSSTTSSGVEPAPLPVRPWGTAPLGGRRFIK